MKPCENFAIDHTVTARLEDGTETEEIRRDYFFVVNVSHAKARRSLMHIVDSASEPDRTKTSAFEVQ